MSLFHEMLRSTLSCAVAPQAARSHALEQVARMTEEQAQATWFSTVVYLENFIRPVVDRTLNEAEHYRDEIVRAAEVLDGSIGATTSWTVKEYVALARHLQREGRRLEAMWAWAGAALCVFPATEEADEFIARSISSSLSVEGYPFVAASSEMFMGSMVRPAINSSRNGPPERLASVAEWCSNQLAAQPMFGPQMRAVLLAHTITIFQSFKEHTLAALVRQRLLGLAEESARRSPDLVRARIAGLADQMPPNTLAATVLPFAYELRGRSALRRAATEAILFQGAHPANGFAGLSPEQLERVGDMLPNIAVWTIQSIAASWKNAGDVEAALTLIEQFVDASAACDVERFARRALDQTKGAEPDTQMSFVTTTASAIHASESRPIAVASALIEGVMGLHIQHDTERAELDAAMADVFDRLQLRRNIEALMDNLSTIWIRDPGRGEGLAARAIGAFLFGRQLPDRVLSQRASDLLKLRLSNLRPHVTHRLLNLLFNHWRFLRGASYRVLGSVIHHAFDLPGRSAGPDEQASVVMQRLMTSQRGVNGCLLSQISAIWMNLDDYYAACARALNELGCRYVDPTQHAYLEVVSSWANSQPDRIAPVIDLRRLLQQHRPIDLDGEEFDVAFAEHLASIEPESLAWISAARAVSTLSESLLHEIGPDGDKRGIGSHITDVITAFMRAPFDEALLASDRYNSCDLVTLAHLKFRWCVAAYADGRYGGEFLRVALSLQHRLLTWSVESDLVDWYLESENERAFRVLLHAVAMEADIERTEGQAKQPVFMRILQEIESAQMVLHLLQRRAVLPARECEAVRLELADRLQNHVDPFGEGRIQSASEPGPTLSGPRLSRINGSALSPVPLREPLLIPPVCDPKTVTPWLAENTDLRDMLRPGEVLLRVAKTNDGRIIRWCVEQREGRAGVREIAARHMTQPSVFDELRLAWTEMIETCEAAAGLAEEHTRCDEETCRLADVVTRLLGLDQIPEEDLKGRDLLIEGDPFSLNLPYAISTLRGGASMIETVASISMVPSVRFRMLLGNYREKRPQPTRNRLLSASWLPAQYGADLHHRASMPGLPWLYATLTAALGNRKDWDVHGLGWAPGLEATPARLDALLSDPESPYRLAVVSGHGDESLAGVLLEGPQFWDGSRADLSQLDLLFLVSCTIGRLEADEVDALGFYPKLAARGVTAVACARWPVHDGIAQELAARTVLAYAGDISAQRQAGSWHTASRRLAEAQRAVLASARPGSTYNAAAFAFYGVG